MTNDMKILDDYNKGLERLTTGVHHALAMANFETSQAALHGLLEVVASEAAEIGCDVGDFLRLALCAWDCSHDRSLICEVERAAADGTAN